MTGAGTAVGRRDYPLTPMQRAMVLASLRAPGSGVYVLQRICECSATLDLPLLQRAWDCVIRRHAALRTSIARGPDDTFTLRVEEAPEIRWEFPQTTQLAAYLREDSERGFRFEDGIPMRLALWRTPRGSTLLWTVHHALLDGRSVAMVWRELFTIYDGLVRGEAISLPAAPDIRSHLDWLALQDFSPSEPYWRRQFAGMSNSSAYITDRIQSAASFVDEAFSKEISQTDDALTRDLEALAARLEVTVNSLVLGAWGLLLSRYSGRRDVVFGVTRHCRHSSVPDAPAMVGPLMNTLPCRLAVDADSPLGPWLQQVRSQWIELHAHEQTPLDTVGAWSSLPPGMPPFDSVVVYDREPVAETLCKLGGPWEDRRFRGQERTDTPMTLVVWGRPVLTLQIVYDTGLFCRETVAQTVAHLETLLRSFVAQPESPLRALRMLSAAEESRLTVQWNSTAAALPQDLCAHHLFEQQARRAPEKPALEASGGATTYGEANRKANQLAWLLRRCGVGPEDFVAVKLPSSPEAVLAVLAVLKAGAAFLLLDPALPAERLAEMMERAAPQYIVEDWPQLEREMGRQSAGDLPLIACPANAAYAIFTSGSTGTPKAVVVTHRSLVNHTLAMTRAQSITGADRRLQFASIGSDVVVAEIFNILSNGATLVFGREQAAGSMTAFLRFLEDRRITMTGMPSTWWHEWVAAMMSANVPLPRFLRVVTAGMERVDPAAYRIWRRLVANRVRWFNAYGPTETTVTSLFYEAGSSVWENERFVPIGRPIANVRAYVLDGECKPVPMGVAGELYIGGAGVARGYLGDDDLTARKFLPDTFGNEPGGRLYRTGDLVFTLPDGNFVFLGRVDRQVKIRGFRVEPEEIEAALAQHPAVRHCAVIATETEDLVAYLAFHRNVEVPTLDEVRRKILRRLPAHMLPREYRVLADMPLTSSGKIDHRALPRQAERLLPAGEYQAPVTATEKRLAPIWQRVLGVPRVSVTENFFECGGNSLRATTLISLLAREFGRELSWSALQRAPTVAQLAAVLESGNASLAVYHPQGARTPFFAVSSAPDDALAFGELARQLGDEWPFVALANPVGRRYLPVEELAARICRTVRTVRPQGPYVLGGYCFGGLLAFEAAHQLAAAGQQVRMVVLFDAPRPGYPRFLGGQLRRLAPSAGAWRPARAASSGW